VRPDRLVRAREAPAVPADAFKLTSVFAHPPAAATITFRTSGTSSSSGTLARGAHSMRDAVTYDEAALAFGRRMLGVDRGQALSVLVLGPSPAEASDSSLAHMCGRFASAWSNSTLRDPFFVRRGALDVASFEAAVRELEPATPALVLATSFALVHLLDALGSGGPLPLPRASRVMHTGGFKGRSREVSRADLRRDTARLFGVPDSAIVAEYGMTELSSQFWESTFVAPGVAPFVYVEPPWARVVAVDPVTLIEVPAGEVGIARIEDLANVDSAFAIVTHDMVRRVDGGFELLGRAPGSAPRGCSIAADEMLSAGGEPASGTAR
jgi:hypothetical protein